MATVRYYPMHACVYLIGLLIVIWIGIVGHHRLALSNLLGRTPPEFFSSLSYPSERTTSFRTRWSSAPSDAGRWHRTACTTRSVLLREWQSCSAGSPADGSSSTTRSTSTPRSRVGRSTVSAGEGARDDWSMVTAGVGCSTVTTATAVIRNYWLPVLRWC